MTTLGVQEVGRSRARSAAPVRTLGLVCLVSGLLGAASGLIVIAWPAQVTTESYSYPFNATSFVVAQVFFAVQHLGLVGGLVGLLLACREHSSRLGVAGSAVAIAGMLVLTGCEVFALTATDALVGSAEAASVDSAYGVPMILNGVGLLLAGIGVVRSRVAHGAWRWLVLAMGVYVFVVLFPAVFGPLVVGRLAIAVWMLMFSALGWGLARQA